MRRPSTLRVLYCYWLAIIVSLLVVDLRYAFFGTAIATCAFVLLGFLVFPVTSQSFVLHLNPIDESKLTLEALQGFRFLGKTLHLRWFSQEIHCVMQLRNTPLLAAAVVAAVTVILAIQRHVPMAFLVSGENAMFKIAVLVLTGSFVLAWAWIWLAEQLFLRKSAATLGLVQKYIDGNQTRAVRYEFYDLQGERRGSTEEDFQGGDGDHALVVLYSPKNPDGCRSSRGFFFHRFLVQEDVELNAVTKC